MVQYEGQEIDISAVEAMIFNQKTKRWIKKPGNFKESDVDIEDIRQLL